MRRRSVVLAVPGLVLSGVAPAQGQIRYTAATAPDQLTKEILTRPFRRLDLGPYDKLTNLRHNVPQILEQNLARLNGRRIAALFENMSAIELQQLAQVYTNATAYSGRAPRLHDLLALRLDGTQLGYVSRAFGFAPLYEAIHRTAPQKANRFLENSNPNLMAPIPGTPPPRQQAPTGLCGSSVYSAPRALTSR